MPALLLAPLLRPAGFGAFSLAFLAWFGALAILRSALMQPYTLAAASLNGAEWRDITSQAGGIVVVGGIVFGGAFAIGGVVIGASSRLGQALLAIGVLAPGLTLQEFWRVASFTARRARTATANDFSWAIGQVIAFAFVLSKGHITVAEGLLAWGLGGWIGAGLGGIQLSVMPRVSLESVRWARQWARTGAWFTATTATYTFGSLALAIIIAARTGSAGLGLFRTVQLLFGPVQLLTIGAEYVFLPHLVRAIKMTAAGAGQSQRYSLAMALSVAAYGVPLLVVGQEILTRVFGVAFAPATVLLLPMLVAGILDASWSGAALLLRARASGGRLLVGQVVYTVVRLSAAAILVSVAGLRGAGWGLVIGSGVATIVFWSQVLLAPRVRGRPAAVEPILSNVPLLPDGDWSE